MTRRGLPRLFLLVLVGLFLAAGWALFGIAVIPVKPFCDWTTFYTAARLYLEGHLQLLSDGTALTALTNSTYASLLAKPIPFQPWVYPPTFLLFLVPFGLLPVGVAYAAFQALSLTGLIAAVRAYLPERSQRWLMFAALLLSPAMAAALLLGQNGLLTSALLLGAFAALPTAPVLAGVLLGLLSFKPQLGLLIPVALLAGRQFRAIASAAVVAIMLALASLAAFGSEIWIRWLEFATGRGAVYHEWALEDRVQGESMYAAVSWLGAAPGLAGLLQLAAIAVAAVGVYWVFSRRVDRMLQFSVLMCAIALASPHLLSYDLIGLSMAAVLLLLVAERAWPEHPGRLIAAVLWGCPLFAVTPVRAMVMTTVILCFLYLCWLSRDGAIPAILPQDINT